MTIRLNIRGEVRPDPDAARRHLDALTGQAATTRQAASPEQVRVRIHPGTPRHPTPHLAGPTPHDPTPTPDPGGHTPYPGPETATDADASPRPHLGGGLYGFRPRFGRGVSRGR